MGRKKTATKADRFIKLAEVAARTSLSPTEIQRRTAAGTFPKNIQLGAKRIAWLEADVERWMADQVAGMKSNQQPQEG